MFIRRGAAIIALQLVLPSVALAQGGLWTTWRNELKKTLETQPHWVTPLETTPAGLTERYRTDFTRGITPAGTTTWNYGGAKGANFIPWHKLEIDIVPPLYIQHNLPAANDGFGDFSLAAKYRIASGLAGHGSYILTAALGGTFPTSNSNNGSPRGSISPTILGGKGFGDFDVQSSFGVTLPTGDTDALGRPVAWNTVGQYRVHGSKPGVEFWPEIESNATFFHGGPNDGQVQNFVSPGFVVSGIPMGAPPESRIRLALGAGIQIATTHFHTFNHALILSTRMNF